MLGELKKGDKVVTSGGIHGTVAGLDERIVHVQIAENLKIKVDKGSITAVLSETEPEKK
jgi:preprotein translocase subunit YajC